MINTVVFDIGNIILNFDIDKIIKSFTTNEEEITFLKEQVFMSPEWSTYGFIDTGYITTTEVVKIIQDRTEHIHDELIDDFMHNCFNKTTCDERVIEEIKKIKANGYKVYLLSNIREEMYNRVNDYKVFDLVDGYVLSYKVHMIKPHKSIFNELINKYNLNPEECLFIDDSIKNMTTANSLGFKGERIIPDNFEDIIAKLDKYNIKRN